MNAFGNSVLLAKAPAQFRIGECNVDLGTHRIARGGNAVRMSAKSIAVLTCLIEHAGQTVSRDRLLAEAWDSSAASDELLTQAIRELRRAFRDDPRTPQYIETIPKSGYRLLAHVHGAETAVADVELLHGLPPASNEIVESAAPAPRPVRRWLLPGLLLVLGLLALIAIVMARWPVPAPPAADTVIASSRVLTSGYGAVEFPSVSPDGALVVYAARLPSDLDSRLYVQTTDGAAPMALSTGGGSATYPVWSPDGTSIAFMQYDKQDCTIHIVAATGGTSRPVAPCMRNTVEYFDWSPDGRELVTQHVADNGQRMVLEAIGIADGSRRELAYAHDAQNDDLSPHYSPDGRRIAFRRGQNPYSDIYVMDADGGNLRALTRIRAAIWGLAWLPDSQRVVFSSNYEDRNRIYAVDLRSGALVPTSLADALFPSVSRRGGKLATVRDHTEVNLAEYRLDDVALPSTARAPSAGLDVWPAYANRGDGLCFVSDRSGSWQLWFSDAAASEPVALTQLERNEILSHPSWAPDDAHIVFVAQHGARSRLLSVDVVSHQLRELAAGANVRAARYAPDGVSIDLVSDRGGSWQLWRYRPGAESYGLLVDEQVIAFDHGPDGAIYYTRADAGGLYRIVVDGRPESTGLPINPSNRLAWNVGAEGIWFVELIDNKHINLLLQRWGAADSSVIRALENFGPEMTIAVSADGTRLALPAMSRLSNAVTIAQLRDAPD